MSLQKTWILPAANKCLIILVFMISCVGNHKNEIHQMVVIPPFEFEMYGNKDSLISKIEGKNIQVDFDDSHSSSDKGIQMYFFGTQSDSVNFYIELYFNEDKLIALKSKITSSNLSTERFDNRIDNEILPAFKKKELSKNFVTFSQINKIKKEALLEVKTHLFVDLMK